MATATDRKRWHRELAKHWQTRPIETCEVRFKGCFGTYGLAPAHSRKRRRIETKEQYFEVVAACNFCHRRLDEQMSHEEMELKVKETINHRR